MDKPVGSNPDSTTSMDATVDSWSGQDNPVEKKNKTLNPASHGFNKAHGNPKFQKGG